MWYLGAGRALNVLDDLSGLQASGTDLESFHSSLYLGPHLEEVGKPCPARTILRVRDIITECGTFTADFTLTGHISLHTDKLVLA
jgi:hypothetical protein